MIGAAAAPARSPSLSSTWAAHATARAVRFRADRAVWRALLRASLPLGLALAINELYLRADTLIISISEPFEQVGLYTLAYRILEFALVARARSS